MNITINDLKEYILNNSSFAREETLDIILANLLEEFKKYNFDLNNIFVKSGETSINFIGKDVVIRLTYIRYNGYESISDYVKNSKSILQPKSEKIIDTGSINYPTILILDKLSVGDVTKQERDKIYIQLREDGYLFNDIEKLENFGRDRNGNIYLLDYGELIYIDKEKLEDPDLYSRTQYKNKIERELKYHSKICKRLNDKYLRNKKKNKLINFKKLILGSSLDKENSKIK